MRSLQNIGENKGLNVLKAVVDANVWISALLTSGNARGIQEKLKEARFQLFFANELLEECLDVIARPKFFGKIKPERRDSLIELIREQAKFVQLPHPSLPSSRLVAPRYRGRCTGPQVELSLPWANRIISRLSIFGFKTSPCGLLCAVCFNQSLHGLIDG